MKDQKKTVKYPGIREAMDGNDAVIMCERNSTDAAGAYPITPSTQMGEYWAKNAANGFVNVSGRPLIFVEPEGEHAAAAVTAGMSMTGLRAANFSSGQGIAYMHESLYAAVGKRLTYVLNMGCRAMTKATLNVHAGHDDYHCVDDTGFFQVMAKNVQEAADLNIISHRIAELALNPGIVGQDGFLTTHLIESLLLPERDLIDEYLGKPEDIIDTPTPAQQLMYGPTRRRIPELWDVDNPVMAGIVQNQDSYMQSVAAQRPFFFDHIAELTDQAMAEFTQLTGREYKRVSTYRCEDAEYILLGQGSVVANAEAVADYLRETRGIKVGVVNMTMFRPFPSDVLAPILKGRKGVAVLERLDQPLAVDLPLVREVRATVSKCVENAKANGKGLPHPHLEAWKADKDVPALYSGSFGMGSRDLQPEALIGAVENMLPDGPKKKLFYLSIDFIHDKPFTPKQEIYQQKLQDAYPKVKDLSVRGSENPNLMPENSITARFHSVGGWGAITTGKNLAMTLFDLLGYHIKANPKYGSEKKGQPTTYYLSAAPEPIRINCEYFYVDVVLSPDPNVFQHSNAIAGLKKGGVFIIQSEYDDPAEVWNHQIPRRYQQLIIENEIKVIYLDGFKIAREIASDPELQFRMQGAAFMGAFFAASPVMEQSKLTEDSLFKAIHDQLNAKFGAKGKRIVDDNVKVVRRGFTEIHEIKDMKVSDSGASAIKKPLQLPAPMKDMASSEAPTTDIHRFWEQTGNFYMTGQGGENLADPFIGVSMIPAATGVFRDMSTIRFEFPEWNAENCTGCGNCWTICPDSAIPGLVNTVGEVFEAVLKRIEEEGQKPVLLRKALRSVEKKLRDAMNAGDESGSVQDYIPEAVEAVKAEMSLGGEEKAQLEAEFDQFMDIIGDFKFSITRPFYTLKENEAAGKGGLLSITVDPYACKGCMECIEVCGDDALKPIAQTEESLAKLKKNWGLWLNLPTTKSDYVRIDDLDEGIGALETMLLDKDVYKSMVGGDGACVGCSEKSIMHLITGTVEALMQPRVKAQVAKIDGLIDDLQKHIRLKLAESIDVADTEAIEKAVSKLESGDLTLSNLSGAMDEAAGYTALDSEWLKRTNQILARLKQLRWQYTQGTTGNGRASLGMINATGCTSVWGSTYPFNPYPFPWANHLFQDCSSMAMGVFEGHMVKMADGFKAIRMAEIELNGGYKPAEHDEFFTYFNWKQFTDEEYKLCPPVLAIGGDGALYDIGFQNVSRTLMSGKPIKIICLDTQVYSNTGGQACTSGFIGQVSDMAEYGKAQHGKQEIRKEFGLIGIAHRTSFILNGSLSNTGHLLENLIRGFNSKRPAVFNIYAPCMPEHGIGDDVAKLQSKLAVESRAYPLFTFDPDEGKTVADCLDLDGNPSMDENWPTYNLTYVDDTGKEGSMDVPMTFADFAVTEGRFRKHFKRAPQDTWNDDMVPLAEFVEMEEDDREGMFPYIWAVDKKNRLARIIVSKELVEATEERRDFWTMLRGLKGIDDVVDVDAIKREAKAEVAQQIASSLFQMASIGGATPIAATVLTEAAAAPATEAAPAAEAAPTTGGGNGASSGDIVEPWIDTAACTGCGECVLVNPNIFGWNDNKKAVIVNPTGGPFKDIVKAAEKCAALVIKPGTPANMNEKGIEKLLKRAEKFNST